MDGPRDIGEVGEMSEEDEWVEEGVWAPTMLRGLAKAANKIADKMEARKTRECWAPRLNPETIVFFKLELLHDGEIDVTWNCEELREVERLIP